MKWLQHMQTESEWSALRTVAAPFAVLGTASIVAGGLVAAVTATAPTEHASWSAAYLVLVVGVAQVALGVGQALLVSQSPTRRDIMLEFLSFNAGNAAVMLGTLLEQTWMVDGGGALLALALVVFLRAVRTPRVNAGWLLRSYQLVIVIVLVSVPIGLLLAHTRAT
jgi:hypothetical protein